MLKRIEISASRIVACHSEGIEAQARNKRLCARTAIRRTRHTWKH